MELRVLLSATLCAAALAACGGGKEGGEVATAASPDTTPETAGELSGATTNAVEQPADVLAASVGAEADDAAVVSAALPDEGRAVAQAVTIPDGDTNVVYNYETAFTKLAPGWSVNWWGSGTVAWAAGRETRAGFTHGGAGAQWFTVQQLPTGGGAHYVYPYGFTRDASYTASVWLRADVPTVVEVMMRRDVSPWNVVARQRVTIGTAWQQVNLAGSYPYGEAGSLRIIPTEVGRTIYIDDMAITKVSSPTPTPPPGGLNLPAAGTTGTTLKAFSASSMDEAFTRFAPGWYFNSVGGTAIANFLATRETRAGYVYSGASSQKFQVIDKNGALIELISQKAFVKGKTYRATLNMRSDVATPVKVYMRRDEHPWDAFAARSVTLGSTWQKVELEGTYISTVAGSLRVNIENPTGTIWVDDVRIEEVERNEMAPHNTATLPDTLFGMHVLRLGSHFNWPTVDTRIIRLHNTGTSWRDLEPTNGGWSWTTGAGKRLDMYVDYAARNPGSQILYTMGVTPQWASSTPGVTGAYGPGSSGAPTNMADWRDYVRTLAQRYKGKIRYWELWNEPDFKNHWTGTNAQLVEMARIAAEELHAADPANRLVGPGFTAGQGMSALDQLLKAGMGAHVDAIGYHFYYTANPENVGAQLDNVRGLMKAHGVDAKPLWITEGAFICDTTTTDCATASPTASQTRSVNARALFMMANRGVANFNFYVWESQDKYRNLIGADFVTPTEAGRAYDEARNWLRGARMVDAFSVNGTVRALRMNRGTENYVILWSTHDGTVVNLPAAWAVNRSRTLMGAEADLPATRQITIGQEPVLLKP